MSENISAPSRDFSKLFMPGAIIVAGAIIGVSIIVALGGYAPANGGDTGGSEAPISVDIDDVDTDSDPYIGNKNAPVVLAYWYDYQCPFCKAVDVGHPEIDVEAALPILKRDYVETGKLKIVFKDYAFLGPDSTTGALYANAVWDLYPSKFYEWHEAMFEAQDEEHGGFGDEASIVQLTRSIAGIDADAVKARVAAKSSEYQAEIDADQAEGSRFGVNGTPGFITGKKLIGGAVDPGQFISAIEEQL